MNTQNSSTVCISLVHSVYLVYNRDVNEYPVNRVLDRVLDRTSEYRILKSVLGYSDVYFLIFLSLFNNALKHRD